MTPQLILIAALIFTAGASAQDCSNARVQQVIAYQREAQLRVQDVGAQVDSVQVLLGGPGFRDPVRDQPDTIYVFAGDSLGRYLLYGLLPDREYGVSVRAWCGAVSGRRSPVRTFRTEPPGAPANDRPENYAILAGAALQCGPRPGTTRGATGPDTADGTCGGVADDDVWFNIQARYPGYRISVRPVGGTDRDVVVELYDGAGEVLACVNDGGAGDTETYELTNVPEDAEIRIRVYTAGATGFAVFELCHEGIAARPVAAGEGCQEVPPVIVDGSGNPGDYIDVVDDRGQVVVSIENIRPLGEVTVAYYHHGGNLRVEDATGSRYASRNVTVRPTQQPDTVVGLRLYLTDAEVRQLLDAAAIEQIGQLAVTKINGRTCSPGYPGDGELITYRGGSRYGQDYVLDVSLSEFSEFFVHPAGEPLSLGTVAALPDPPPPRGWTAYPVPVRGALTVDPPKERPGGPVVLRLLDAAGRAVWVRTYPAAARYVIDLAGLSPGSYHLLVVTRTSSAVLRVLR